MNTQKLPYERPVIQRLNVGLMNKFGTKTEYHPCTHIDGHAVKDLIAAHGSPLFVISEKNIRQTWWDYFNKSQGFNPVCFLNAAEK